MDEVGQVPNLERRGAVYRCRMRCPQHLLREGISPEKSVSLRTKERAIALERLPAAKVALMEYFRGETKPAAASLGGIVPSARRLQRPDHPDLPLLGDHELEALARQFFSDAWVELDRATASNFDLHPEDKEQRQIELEDRLADLEQSSDDIEDPALAAEIDVLRRAGRRSPYNSGPSRLLRSYLRRALVQLCRIELVRLAGDYRDEVTDSLYIAFRAQEAPKVTAPSASRSITLGEAADRYWEEMAAKERTEKTQDRYKAEIAHIVTYFGRDKAMSDLKRADCTAFRDAFSTLPPNFAKRIQGEVDLHRLLASRGVGDPVLAYATLSKYLDALSRFTRWAHREDLLDKDYAEGLEPLSVKPDGSMAKLPFEIADLERFFSRPIYTGCVDDKNGFAKPGPHIVRRARYWAPLIGLFGGLRSGEIFQLTPSHFRVSEAGTPFIVLTKDMKLKNENAEREIPIHPVLIAIGLLSWVERRRSRPHGLLFPEIKPDKYGAASSSFGKRFQSDLKHLELGERRKKLTFHSFRHTFKRALDREEIGEQEKDELCGWARAKKTGRRYGVGLEADKLRRALELVHYDIQLEHLFSHAGMAD